MQDYFNCKKCGDEWGYYPEDYELDEHDKICPFCNMSFRQLWKEVYEEEGFWCAIKEVIKRL